MGRDEQEIWRETLLFTHQLRCGFICYGDKGNEKQTRVPGITRVDVIVVGPLITEESLREGEEEEELKDN